MLFNSLHFLIFFPVVTVLYFLCPHRFRWALLLAASYYFYMCWSPRYIVLLLIATLVNYLAALLLARSERRGVRIFYLTASLVISLGMLFLFKYFNFLNDNLKALFDSYDLAYPIPYLKILLPVGISFYTFQKVGYTIDVYRGVTKPERHLGYFAVYGSFFPQLVAGPIERSTNLLPQFYREHRFDFERFRSGLLIMGAGFFKKIVIADRLSVYVNDVFNDPAKYQGLPVIIATYFFAFQIFCDFSGYSDIAIGAARILGFDLMQNFNRPYHARSIADFWRRWHISLSTWFRDYVYLPLGGNRVPVSRWYVNILLVFLLSGAWHGANWTFVLWGALHGTYMIVGAMTAGLRKRTVNLIGLAKVPALHHLVQVVITFHLVVLAWVFFRAGTVADGLLLIQRMFQGLTLSDPNVCGPMQLPSFLTAVGSIIILEVTHVLDSRGPLVERVLGLPLPFRWAAYYALAFGILIFGTFTAQEFIYFQF